MPPRKKTTATPKQRSKPADADRPSSMLYGVHKADGYRFTIGAFDRDLTVIVLHEPSGWRAATQLRRTAGLGDHDLVERFLARRTNTGRERASGVRAGALDAWRTVCTGLGLPFTPDA